MHRSMGSQKLARSLLLFATALPAAMMSFPAAVRAVELPEQALGTWSRKCSDAKSPRIAISNSHVSVSMNGKSIDYAGVDISYTWYGGVKATEEKSWVLVSKRPGDSFEFIIEVAMTGSKRAIRIEEGSVDRGREVRKLFGKRFVRCG
jgi:hypothetical protein